MSIALSLQGIAHALGGEVHQVAADHRAAIGGC